MLKHASFPGSILQEICMRFIKHIKSSQDQRQEHEWGRVVVILYVHALSHRIKKNHAQVWAKCFHGQE